MDTDAGAKPSIAVLPFPLHGEDRERADHGDAIAEAVAGILTRIPFLEVASGSRV